MLRCYRLRLSLARVVMAAKPPRPHPCRKVCHCPSSQITFPPSPLCCLWQARNTQTTSSWSMSTLFRSCQHEIFNRPIVCWSPRTSFHVAYRMSQLLLYQCNTTRVRVVATCSQHNAFLRRSGSAVVRRPRENISGGVHLSHSCVVDDSSCCTCVLVVLHGSPP